MNQTDETITEVQEQLERPFWVAYLYVRYGELVETEQEQLVDLRLLV